MLVYFSGSSEVNNAIARMLEASGGDAWTGSKLQKLLSEAGLVLKYEAPLISFFMVGQRLTFSNGHYENKRRDF